MPGAAEFPISARAPMEVRKGVKNDFHVDKTIKGSSGQGQDEIASQPVADQFFASKMGLFQKCIGISWGGFAIFVSGCDSFNTSDVSLVTFAFANKKEEKGNPVVTGLGNAFDGGGSFGGAVAGAAGSDFPSENGSTPDQVLVVVGALDLNTTASVGKAAASKSKDNFETNYTLPNPPDSEDQGGTGAEVIAVVYNKDAQTFYAAGHDAFRGETKDEDGNVIDTFSEDHDILLISRDGFGWSEVGRTTFREDDYADGDNVVSNYPTNPLSYSGLLVAHCNPSVVDEFGRPAPGGYGVNESTNVTIKPNTLFGVDYVFGFSPGFPSNPPSTVLRNGQSIDVGIPVTAVAFAGGIWMAVGGTTSFDGGTSAAAYSFDDGQTWTVIKDVPAVNQLTCVAGAKIKP